MKCPSCQSKVDPKDVSAHLCPTCSRRIYFSDEWRWLRAVACGMLSLLSVCYWFPLDLNPVQLIICLGSYLVVFIFLFIGSFWALPPRVDLLPGQGPIRLDI